MLSALVGRITTHDIVFPLDLLSDLRLSPESGGWMDPRTSDTFDFCRGAHAGTSPSRGISHWQTEPQWNAGFGASATGGSTAMPQIFPLPSTTNSWYPGHIGLGGTHLHRHSVTVSSRMHNPGFLWMLVSELRTLSHTSSCRPRYLSVLERPTSDLV